MNKKLHWMRLDNAAKIYPAAKRRNWTNLFRLSATLTETVDPEVLNKAIENTLPRFPSIGVRIRRGAFWYYLEEVETAPKAKPDGPFPLMRMKFREVRRCAFRVLYYENRIAVELFHALTDGNGGLIFLKTLVAEYIELKYGEKISATNGVLSRNEPPKAAELEDSFLKYSGEIGSDRSESSAFRLSGSKEDDGFFNLTTGILPVSEVLSLAKQYKVSLTEFMVSVLIACIVEIQNEKTPKRKKQKPVKILVPVNLRKFFPSTSLRNFVLFVTPGIKPQMGEWTLEEITKAIHHQMGTDNTAKEMAGRIAANVLAEKAFMLKIMPLFIKNLAMKLVYNAIGESKSCIDFSNLGKATVPDEMQSYVTRLDFILGVQATCPSNCGAISYGEKLYINFIRDIKEPTLERMFFTYLRRLGIHVKIESNSSYNR